MTSEAAERTEKEKTEEEKKLNPLSIPPAVN